LLALHAKVVRDREIKAEKEQMKEVIHRLLEEVANLKLKLTRQLREEGGAAAALGATGGAGAAASAVPDVAGAGAGAGAKRSATVAAWVGAACPSGDTGEFRDGGEDDDRDEREGGDRVGGRVRAAVNPCELLLLLRLLLLLLL